MRYQHISIFSHYFWSDAACWLHVFPLFLMSPLRTFADKKMKSWFFTTLHLNLSASFMFENCPKLFASTEKPIFNVEKFEFVFSWDFKIENVISADRGWAGLDVTQTDRQHVAAVCEYNYTVILSELEEEEEEEGGFTWRCCHSQSTCTSYQFAIWLVRVSVKIYWIAFQNTNNFSAELEVPLSEVFCSGGDCIPGWNKRVFIFRNACRRADGRVWSLTHVWVLAVCVIKYSTERWHNSFRVPELYKAFT